MVTAASRRTANSVERHLHADVEKRRSLQFPGPGQPAGDGLSREDAYILCSLAGDLRISQIVDEPNFGVSFYMPLSIFS